MSLKLICRVRSTKVKRGEDLKVNVFAADVSNENPQNLVVSSKYPISVKFIKDYLKTDQDMIKQKLIENSDLFQFDQVFSGASQSTFYDLVCSNKINDSLNGVCSSYLIIGGEQCGKKYTLKGEDKGIAYQAVENILNLFEMHKQSKSKPFKLQCRIYAANETEIFDLIGNQKNQNIKHTNIKHLTDFKNLLRQAFFQLKSYQKLHNTTNQVIISLNIQQDKVEVSQINFIIYNEFTKQTQEAFDNQNNLKAFLLAASEERDPQLQSKVFEALYIALTQARLQNISVIFHVSNDQTHFIHAYRTLQFAEELRQLKSPMTNRTVKSQIFIQDQKSPSSLSRSFREPKSQFIDYRPQLRDLSQSKQNTNPTNPSFRQASKQSFGNQTSKISVLDRIPSDQTLGSQQFKQQKENFNPNLDQNSKNLSDIKELIREKERYSDSILRTHEIEKQNLLEDNIRLQNKVDLLTEQVTQRDLFIKQLENHIDDNKRQIQMDQQMYLTAKQKENLYESNQEELREMVAQLTIQLRQSNDDLYMCKSKTKILEQDIEDHKQQALQNIKHYEKREDEFMQLLRQEKDRNTQLYDDLEYFNRQLREKDSDINQLEDNVRTLNKVIEDFSKRFEDEKQKQKELQEQYGQKQKKTDDILKEFNTLETKHAKIKSKLETENKHLKEDKEKYLSSYKDKLKRYKVQLRQLEHDNQDLRMINLKLSNENEQLISISKQLESQLGNLNTEVPLIERQKDQFNSELERLQMYSQQLQQQIKQQDYEISQINGQLTSALQQLDRANQIYEQVMRDNQLLSKQLEEKKNELKQNEYMMEKMVELSNQQMDDMESKFHKLNAQVNTLNHEKKSLLTELTNSKMNLEQIEGNELILEKRLVKLRKENKDLNRQLKDLNQNMREMIVEKHSEIKNNNSMHQSRFSGQSYRSIRTNNLMMSNEKELDDDDEEY